MMQQRFGGHSRAHHRENRGRAAEYKIVVLGAGGVGKSCLTAQFVQNTWIEHYDPTIEDIYRKQLEVDGRQCVLEIMDTAGTEQFTGMREIYLNTGHGFLLVFSITSLNSLLELSELREQIIRIKDDVHTPLVIVGNKSDLEEDRAVSRARAFALSQSWGNAPYYETSARRRTNVDEVFRDLCRQIILRDPSMMSSSSVFHSASALTNHHHSNTTNSSTAPTSPDSSSSLGPRYRDLDPPDPTSNRLPSSSSRPKRAAGVRTSRRRAVGGGGGGGGKNRRRDDRICAIL